MDLTSSSANLAHVGALLRRERRRQGVSQTRAAREVGAKQSQISGLENGKPVLSTEKIERLARFLEVDLTDFANAQAAAQHLPASSTTLAYCVSTECPGNMPYFVQGRGYFKPTFMQVGSSDAKCCPLCGEPAQTRCEGCGSSVRKGLFCPDCGRAYVDADCGLFTGASEDQIAHRCELIRREKAELIDIGPAR